MVQEYCGQYEDITFVLEDNHLFWDQGGGVSFVLIPISVDHFVFDDSDDYMVAFYRDDNHQTNGYRLLIKGRENNPLHPKTGK